ncbi:hypothetical protein ACQKWADRAFT_5952 [Trichoderma austrokoningii]
MREEAEALIRHLCSPRIRATTTLWHMSPFRDAWAAAEPDGTPGRKLCQSQAVVGSRLSVITSNVSHIFTSPSSVVVDWHTRAYLPSNLSELCRMPLAVLSIEQAVVYVCLLSIRLGGLYTIA